GSPSSARYFERDVRRDRDWHDARRARPPHRAGRRASRLRRPHAGDRPTAGRHPRPARPLALLLPARHLHRAVAAAHPAVLALRPPVRATERAALVTVVALVALVAPAAAQDTIRVAVVDGARVAELRGDDIDVVELGPGASGAWRASVVRPVVVSGTVEIDGRRAPA